MAGRPREFDRDAVLRQLQSVFWTRGYEGVTMADLVEASGLASARLYAAFGSKEALFREAVRLYAAEEGGFAERAFAEEPTVVAAVRRTLHEAVTLYTEPSPRGCMVVTAATNCSTANEHLRAWLSEMRVRRTRGIIARVADGVATGELPAATDPTAVGDALAAVLHGLSIQARDGIPARRLHSIVGPVVSMLVADR